MAPDMSNFATTWGFFGTLAWIIQGVGGAESVGVFLNDLKGGVKAFVRTVVIAGLTIGLLYAGASLLVNLFIPEAALPSPPVSSTCSALSLPTLAFLWKCPRASLA